MERNKTVKKKPKTCHAIRYDDFPCGRSLYDDKHCIFHSKDIEGKKEVFSEKFWNEFETQKMRDKVYDFTDFIFPDSVSFGRIVFNKNVYFKRAKFFGNINDFREVEFSNDYLDFSRAEFLGKTIRFEKA